MQNHLGDWKKVSREMSRIRVELSVQSQIAHYLSSNNTHEKISRFWLAESSAIQVKHHCKLHILILDYDLRKGNESLCKPVLNNDKNFVRKLWKKFSPMWKNGFKEHFPALPLHEFFHVCIFDK